MRFLLCLFFVLRYMAGFSQEADSFINAAESRRIISILASDSLKGRANFSNEIGKAASFIAGEFEKGGLKPFQQFRFFVDPFLLLDKVEPLERVMVNNEPLSPKQYFFISPFEFPPSLELKNFKVKSVNPDISVTSVLDSLRLWRDIDLPLLLLLPHNRKDILKALHDPATIMYVQNNIRLIIGQPNQLKQVSVFFKPELRNKMLFNVIGYLPGRSKPDELVLVTAHYDHVGIIGSDVKDSVFNGANDNASGTTSMMMLANYFASRNDNERSIVFVAFAGEEIGLVGSQHLASILNSDSIVAVVNLEMLGKSLKREKRSCIVTGAGPLPDFFRKEAKRKGIDIRYDNNYRENLFNRSDNYPFARRGIPAHTFMIFINNDPDYHQTSDEIETLDLENMAEIVKGLVGGIEGLASGRFTPAR